MSDGECAVPVHGAVFRGCARPDRGASVEPSPCNRAPSPMLVISIALLPCMQQRWGQSPVRLARGCALPDAAPLRDTQGSWRRDADRGVCLRVVRRVAAWTTSRTSLP